MHPQPHRHDRHPRRTRPRTGALGALAVAAALALAACGSGDESADPADDVTATAADDADGADGAATSLGEAEVEFAQGMIAHHEQAIEMAEMALDPAVGASPAVVDLATRIQAAQDPEVQLMTGWLTEAGRPLTMDTSDGHDMSEMEGMMSAEQMDALAAATGAEFDRLWLEMMIEHHEGAISQSETVQADGVDAEVLALADQIITAQRAEIDEMRALLGG